MEQCKQKVNKDDETLQLPFFTMPQMFRQQVQIWVKPVHGQCVFIVKRMFCLCFSLISWKSNQSRSVFVSLFLFFYCLWLTILCQTLVLKCSRFYNVFGSGASHGIHSQLMTQAAAFNKWRKIGLLQGAGTNLSTWFYSMHQFLWMRLVLKAAIHNPNFTHLPKNWCVEDAIKGRCFLKGIILSPMICFSSTDGSLLLWFSWSINKQGLLFSQESWWCFVEIASTVGWWRLVWSNEWYWNCWEWQQMGWNFWREYYTEQKDEVLRQVCCWFISYILFLALINVSGICLVTTIMMIIYPWRWHQLCLV